MVFIYSASFLFFASFAWNWSRNLTPLMHEHRFTSHVHSGCSSWKFRLTKQRVERQTVQVWEDGDMCGDAGSRAAQLPAAHTALQSSRKLKINNQRLHLVSLASDNWHSVQPAWSSYRVSQHKHTHTHTHTHRHTRICRIYRSESDAAASSLIWEIQLKESVCLCVSQDIYVFASSDQRHFVWIHKYLPSLCSPCFWLLFHRRTLTPGFNERSVVIIVSTNAYYRALRRSVQQRTTTGTSVRGHFHLSCRDSLRSCSYVQSKVHLFFVVQLWNKQFFVALQLLWICF